jgi:hypothetical protein
MGCDIHIVLERKDRDNVWIGWKQMTYMSTEAIKLTYTNYETPHEMPRFVSYIIDQRNYSFFNALCGVRGPGSEFGYEPRGLPNDASRMTRMCLSEDDVDLHSHSWLSIKELVPCLAAHWGNKKKEEYIFERMANEDGNLYLATQLVDEGIVNDNADEWRFVFAFDN